MRHDIVVVGLSHKTAPLELREALNFSPSEQLEALRELKERYPLNEYVVLSTCNRVEIYAASEAGEICCEALIEYLSSSRNIPKARIVPFIYSYVGGKAIEHLFSVASGLDSLVIGEAQILGQVKGSYQKSLEMGALGKVLNSVFQEAFHVAKKIRTLTRIGFGNVSIASVSCQLAEEVLGGLYEKKILLVGTGKVGTLTLKSLRSKSAHTVLVSSRNYEKAKILASEFNGTAVRFDLIESFMLESDIVISSTSAPHYVIRPDMIKRVMEKRGTRSIFLIDLAVPRDIDPLVESINNVYLYNIDSLKRIAEENITKRSLEISECKRIIQLVSAQFMGTEPFGLRPHQGIDDKLLETAVS